MKLNKISTIFANTRNKANHLAVVGTTLTAILAAPNVMAQAEPNTDTQDVEVIEVRGMLGSIKAAALLKRTDGRIVDAIVAEDIGKLPDNNIAEALQRITGVSINTDFGVGSSVSIRGLSENRVELNGRSTIGDSRDGISLEDFPSSFLKTVEVVKSPTADMIEGALGGTVSLKTVRPLELDDLTIAGSLSGEYADKTENWAPIINFTVGDNWDFGDSGTFGAMLMISYQDRELRQDEFFNRVSLYDEDVNGMSANTPSGLFAVRDQNTVQQFVENRERTAINLSLQWAPASGNGMVYLDLNTTERTGSQAGNSILDAGGSRVYDSGTTQDGNGQVNNYTLTDAYIIPKTWSDFRSTDSYSHALGGEWYLSDTVKMSGEIAIASSDSSLPQSEFNLRPVNRTNWQTWADQYDPATSNYDDDLEAFGLRHTVDATFSQSGNKIPSIVYSDPSATTGAENLALRAFYHDDDRTQNEETAMRLDFEIIEPLNMDWISKIKTGVRTTDRDYKFTRSRYRADNLYRNVFYNEGTDEETPFAMWIDEFEDLFPGSFTTVNYPNSFDQSGLSGANALTNYRVYSGHKLSNAQATFAKVQQILEGTNLATTGSLKDNTVFQEGAFRDINEETAAAYISAYLDFGDLTAIVGGRYVTTDIESSVYVDGNLVTGTHDYSDFLPSLNVSYNLNEDTVLRFAAAKVMRRADFDQLSPAFTIDNSLYNAERGSLTIDPHRATQYDLSIEHYFGNANMVSFAVFYKDVESFLSNSTTCVADSITSGQNVTEWQNICVLDNAGVSQSDVNFQTLADFGGSDSAGFDYTADLRDAGLTGIVTDQVTNGDNGKVQGIEVGYQQNFDFLPGAWSGLGVVANYTYADSEQPNGNALLDISKNTVNAQIYWEYEQFQVRLAYNYRDEFLDTEDEKRVATIGELALNSSTDDETSALYDPTAGNNYRDSRGQFDFSASWDIDEHFTLVGNITNLTGEPSRWSSALGSTYKYTEADRRMTVGVRATF
jgi:TonB-dependent receptor